MPTDLTYLTYLVIITKEDKLVKEVIFCDILPVAMFGIIKLMPYNKVGSFWVIVWGGCSTMVVGAMRWLN